MIVELYEYINEFGYYGPQTDKNSGHKAKGSAMRNFREYLKDVNFQFTTFS